MKKRSANRFRLSGLIALTGALALGSFWVLEVMRKSLDNATPQPPRSRPDYYVEKFNFVRMAKTGLAQYNISGEKMVHNPVDDSHEIKLPDVHSLSKERPPMTIRSERAIVDRDSGKVHMYERVHIDRPATPTNQHFHLTSEYLLLLPDEDVIETDKPVVITLGTSRLTGIGMVANNATRELRLSSNVHASYQPPPKAASR